MFTAGANYSKLKTNLRLVVSRLKLLEKKKTELTQKARREIAEYINGGKYDRARIRVEHIIREDYLVEAMEVVEMYCDLLLARFGLIQQMKTLDEGLKEAISSIIWVSPRLQADAAELKIVADQLTMKYGKPFAQAARENSMNTVNEKLMHKLSVQAPPKILVEKYMIEIAKSHNIAYEPDPDVLREDECLSGEIMANGQLIDLEDSYNKNNKNFFSGSGGGGGMPCVGGATGGSGGMPYMGGATGGNPAISMPFPTPSQAMNQPFSPMPVPFCYPAPVEPPEKPSRSSPIPPLPSQPPSGPYPGPTSPCEDDMSLPPPYGGIPAPPYDTVVNPSPTYFSKPTAGAGGISDTLPELPAVPNSSLPGLESKNEEVDFDELTKRFEDLKKRK